MTRQGRPLRFLGASLGVWALARVGIAWPSGGAMPEWARLLSPLPPAFSLPLLRSTPSRELARYVPPPRTTPFRPAPPPTLTALVKQPPDPARIALAAAALVRFGEAEGEAPTAAIAPGARPLLAERRTGSRLAGSGWLLVRGQGALGGGLTAGQLGGAQGGFRLSYALDGARRLSLTARLSSALHVPQREAALGLAWKPTAAPVTLVAEQRFGLAGERGGPTLGVIAGLNPTPIAAGFRLEAYGQAGAVKRGGLDKFADGAMRLARPVAAWWPVRLDVGAGAWGGAQPGAARLDLGPSASLALPAAGRQLRLTLDWRQRVAGSARPGSGPALSLGTDF